MIETLFSKEFRDVKLFSGIFYSDERGFLKKTMYGEKLNSLMEQVCEVIISNSYKNVIRGLHFQNPPYEISKLVTCVSGEILDCFVDLRKNSNTYGKHATILLKEGDSKSIFIPKGFAHGYSVLSENATVVYLQSGSFNSDFDCSINPLSLNIDWKISNPIISQKDLNATKFESFISNF